MIKKKYMQPESLVVTLHSECAIMQYSYIKNGTNEPALGIRGEEEDTDIEVN